MILAMEEHYVLPSWVPTWVIGLMVAGAVTGWVLLHMVGRRETSRRLTFALTGAAVLVGFGAMLAAAQLLLRWLVLATDGPVWLLALIGAVAVEGVTRLYSLERRTLSRPLGFVLCAIRVALVALVLLMLAQPVHTWESSRTTERHLAILLDDSASMLVPDTQMTPVERIRLAEALRMIEVHRPYRLEEVAERLAAAQKLVQPHATWLEKVTGPQGDADREELVEPPEEMLKALTAARDILQEQSQALSRAAEGEGPHRDTPTQAAVTKAVADLADSIQKPLAQAIAILEDDAGLQGAAKQLHKVMEQAVAGLETLGSEVRAVAQSMDQSFYESLPAEQRAKADALSEKPRAVIARDVLLEPFRVSADEPEVMPLLKRLEDKYGVNAYKFATSPVELNLEQWSNEVHTRAPDASAIDEAPPPPEQMRTDIGTALEQVFSDMADQQLSGIVLLTDGRHNTRTDAEAVAQQFSHRQVPVCTVLIGSAAPPVDAGIVSVEAPEVITKGDKLYTSVEVKLDGLAGKKAAVRLYDGDEAVDSKTVEVTSDSQRTSLQLAHLPEAIGPHRYRVEVQQFDDEVLEGNNSYPLLVTVTDERIKLLMIEGRPRWEFRYVKNLFARRDKSVHLQYVLLEPDRVAGQPPSPPVAASVTRPQEEAQATSLPNSKEEWMKFDVVMLGDVAPTMLGPSAREALRQFVVNRGGNLVIAAGRLYMPHAFGDTALAELLPVNCGPSDRPVLVGPDPAFRIALTPEGTEHIIMRQKVDPVESIQVWRTFPALHWRHPSVDAKPGATVLAYALPPSPPPYLGLKTIPDESPRSADGSSETPETVLRKRRQFYRENALVSLHRVGGGRVLFLSTDRTWRMRYRIGDTHHYKFWGQVLRWATANKLPAGTEFVRIGTDRTRYPPQAHINIRAMIRHLDYTPLKSDRVAVKVLLGRQVVLQKELQYEDESPGMYSADLGQLPGGTYRVELVAEEAKPILAAGNVDTVWTEFSVDPAYSTEQVELTPDPGLVGRLASVSGGTVVDSSRAHRILELLGPGTITEREQHEYVLWSSWLLLGLIVLLATAEWVLRKKVGLI